MNKDVKLKVMPEIDTCKGCYFRSIAGCNNREQFIDNIKHNCSIESIIYVEDKGEEVMSITPEEYKKLADRVALLEGKLLANTVIEEIKENDKLYLEVEDGELKILYKYNLLGVIDEDGECCILSDNDWIKTYEDWRDNGMLIDESVVVWKGGEYQLIQDIRCLRRVDLSSGQRIYDFASCLAITNCNDDNLVRFKHNSRSIIF